MSHPNPLQAAPDSPYTGRIMVRLTNNVQQGIANHYAGSGSYLGNVGMLATQGLTPRLKGLVESLRAEAKPLVLGEHVELVRRLEARAQESAFPPLRSLLSYVVVDTRAALAQWPLAEVLARFAHVDLAEEVDFALAERRLGVPVAAVTPGDDPLVAKQGYLEGESSSPPEPNLGINVHNSLVWGLFSGKNVGFVDIERGWAPKHDDLPPIPPILWPGPTVPQVERDHGTMVLGIVVGLDNTTGIVGIAPGARFIGCASHDNSPANKWDLSGAMLGVFGSMNPGDVLLLELQTIEKRGVHFYGLPVEVEPQWLDSIRVLVANDIVVVECAGNGVKDLDANPSTFMQPGNPAPPYDLNRNSANFADSGAIMVSGCESDINNSPVGTHTAVYNFGSRIDCYAWGEEAYSTYWSKSAPAVFNDYDTFQGTSAAGAIIAGAAILVQDMAKSRPGPYLQPAQLRALLSEWGNGTSIVDTSGTQVGVMPDLVKVGQSLGALPDIYVRDSLLDNGDIPTAMLSQSPDIIVRSTQVANPELEFGRMGAFADAYVTNHMVQAGGAPNYLYVRMLNRTGHTATKARATVYWAPISPLILPSDWHLIGTSVAVPIPGVVNPGDPHTMVVAELPVWTPLASEFPPSGHACFVAVLDDPKDPAPVFFATPGASTVTDAQFAAALGRYNNAAFRNFTVSVTSSTMSASTAGDPADAWATQPPIMFHIRGLESRGIVTGFALEHDAPRDVKIEVELPDDLTSEVEFANARLKRHRSRGRAVIELDCDRRRAVYGSVPMPAGSRHRCVLRVRDSSGESSKPWHVVIRQHIEGRWVGALTFSFGAGDTPEGLR